MKKHSLRKSLALIIALLVLVTALPLGASADDSASSDTASAPDYVVLSASEITASTAGLSATTSVVANDTLKKQMLRTEITHASTGGDNVYITYNVSASAVNAKDYPYFRIGYRAKTSNATYTDLNVNFDKYHPAGTGDAVSTRLWGPMPTTVQETFSDFKISYSQYTDGSGSWDTTTNPWTNLGYSWDWIDDESIYTSFVLKPWPTSTVSVALGDYFEIEYIAFFKNTSDMNDFVYSPKLNSLEATESLELHLAETKILEVTTAPAGVYANLTYTSDNTSVATVTGDGKVYGVSAGTANITVATADNSKSATCEVTVLDSVATNYVVVSASELEGKTAKSTSLTGTVTLDSDETAQTSFISTKITSTGGQGDSTSIEYTLSSFNIPVKAYPYIQISYKAKTQNATRADVNVGLSAYQSDATTITSPRLWGPTPTIAQQTYSKMNIDYTSYNGGQNIGASYSWDKVTSDSTCTFLRLKPWYFGQAVSGDYFDVEYIAFFADTASRDSFVYDTAFKSMTVDSTMNLERGTYNKVGVQLTPAGAFVKLKYTSSAPDIASVSSDGTVVAKKAGTAQITVSTLDDSCTGTCTVTVSDSSKDYSKYITERDDLSNTLYKLNTEKKLNIVYLGGSVTAGAGASGADFTSWRGITGNWFKQMFPDANIKLVNSAMGGSGSMLGAFRTSADVLAHDPDLVFVEYAVNDSYSGHYADGTVQFYYESVIRQIRESSPDTDIISIFTTDQSKLYDTTMHAVATLQDEVAEHYGISSIDVGLALANHIVAENAEWSDYVADSVHPKDAGYTIYANVIKQFLFDKLFCAETLPTAVAEHTLPSTYVDQRNASFYPNYVKVEEGIFDSITNWSFGTDKVWSNIDTAGYISPNGLNNSFSYTFNGTGVAFFMEFNVSTNSDGKQTYYLVEYSIDDEESQVLRITDTNHPFNKMFKTGTLEDGEHTITFSYLGMDVNGDGIVDDGETGVRPGLKITRLLVSQTEAPTDDQIPGDVNGDGKVDATDSLMLSRHIASWSGYGAANGIVLANANVDGVDGVTANDGVVLSRHIANWSGYSKLPLTN